MQFSPKYCIALNTLCFDSHIYSILMQNGEHIIVLHNYLKYIAVIKMGYRMAVTFFRKMLHESDC